MEIPLWCVVNWCLQKSDQNQDNKKSGDFPNTVWQKMGGQGQVSAEGIAGWLRKFDDGKFRFPATAKKALQMLRQLYETGFASFAG